MPSKYVSRQCVRCNKGFQTTQTQVNQGMGRFCGSSCAAFARQERTGPLKCSQCGCARSITARKENGMCRRCSAKSYGKRGRPNNVRPFGRATMPNRPWAFASDSKDAKSERAKVWTEAEERPRIGNTIPLNTITKHGRVSAVGLRDGLRYYCLTDVATGAISQMPADVLERHGEAQKAAS
jgi:hypothetical protein